MSLRRRAVRGVLWSSAENWGSSLISMLVIFVLARLLDKEAFGVVAFASLLTIFLSIFQRQGLTQAIVQRRDLKPGHLDTAFWTSASAGVLLAALMLVLADSLPRWFDKEGMSGIIRWLSLTVIFDSLVTTPTALLRRELAFRALAVRSLAAAVVGGIVGVGMALNGYGVWSLVGQRIAASVAGTIALWTASPWRPGVQVSMDYFKDLFGFGAFSMGREIVGFFGRRSDELVVATWLGMDALGVYWIGRQLLHLMNRLFTHSVSSVALPTFSRLQDDHARMRSSLLTATRVVSLMVFPAFSGVVVLAPELVAVMFGDKWSESVPIIRLLSMVGIVQCVIFFNRPAIVACGKPAWTFAIASANAGIGVLLYIGAVRWGIVAVATAHLAINLLLAPLPVWLVRKLIGLEIREYLRQFVAPLTSSLVMVAVVWMAKWGLSDLLSLPVRLAVCIISGVAVYTLMILWRAPNVARELSDSMRLALSRGGEETGKE